MKELFAKDIMTKKVITIDKDSTVGDLAKLLIKKKISGVPVVDEKKDIVGIITEGDIILKESSLPLPISFSFSFMNKYETYMKSTEEYLKTKVEDVMTRTLNTVKEDAPLSKVVNVMLNNKINRVPVLDKENKLVGIITRANIIESILKSYEQYK